MNQEFQVPKTFKAAQLSAIGQELVVVELETPQSKLKKAKCFPNIIRTFELKRFLNQGMRDNKIRKTIMTEYNLNLIEKFNPKHSQIFKFRRDGMAICKCCYKTITFQDSIQDHYMKHYIQNSHIQYLADQYDQDTNFKVFQNTGSQLSKPYQKKIEDQMDQILGFNFEKLFFLVAYPEAKCLLCNKRIIITGSLNYEFFNHFSQKSHQGYLRDIFDLTKNEQQLVQQSAFKKKQIKIAKKKDIKIQQYLNEADEKEQFFENQTKSLKQGQYIRTKQLDQFLELVLKHFQFYLSKLILNGNYLEAICYVLSLCGKDEKQICQIQYEDIAQEMRFLSYYYIFSTDIQMMLQYSFGKLWRQNRINNQDYLFIQPYRIKDLRKMLINAKNMQCLKKKDKQFQEFLIQININQLVKVSSGFLLREGFEMN